MKTYNQVTLMGYVASEPSEQNFENGTRCVKLSLKTLDYYGSPNGKKVDRNFHNLILWNSISDMASVIMKKGDLILVTGRLKNNKVDVKGSDKPFYKTEVVVEDWTRIKGDDLEDNED